MDFTVPENLIATLEDALLDPLMWLQLLVLILSFGVAVLLHRFGSHYLTQGGDKPGLKHFTLGASQRLLFPFTMLLLIVGSRALYKQLALPVIILDIAVTLLLSLAIVRSTIYVLRKAFTPSPLLRAWENTLSTVIWIAVALHLLGILPEVVSTLDSLAITFGDNRISLLWILKLLVSVAFFLLLSLWISSALEKRITRSSHISASMKVGISKSMRVVIITLAFVFSLDAIGFDLTALTVFGGALGVGLGFGLQRIASNFVSGFILLFDRSIRPGDVISVGNSFGWVEALRARYIVVRDRDGVETLIPNENIITSEVINWSYSDCNVRVKLPVQISYRDDPETAMQLMLEAAQQCNRILTEPKAVSRLMRFGESGIDLELRVWIRDPQAGIGSVRSEIYLAIWKTFKLNNITIPYPQRDLHILDTAKI
ncbi:MAG: mechanosensitive ion channel [Gammaproteobacteria bacterium]|nr:MAG: mechanosensitive ion channel [Gammaproteobacteria bacterium]